MKDSAEHREDGRPEGTYSAVHSEKVEDYSGTAEPLLPVLEVSATQLAPGPPPSNVGIFSSDKVNILAVHFNAPSVGTVIIKPECFGFMWWDGPEECRINGVHTERSLLHTQGEQDGFHAVGGKRRTAGLTVRRDDLISALAALRGVGPEDVHLGRAALRLSDAAAQRYRRDIKAFMGAALEDGARTSNLGDALFGVLLEAFLGATPEQNFRSTRRPAEQIVRRAEERYFEAEGGPVSLADLCAAAGVSQSVLYRAFHSVCDDAPLAYFHKRRLNEARRVLMTSERYRGAVKNAALSAGLTEMGRFSLEYRSLFGKSPSATLSMYGR